MSLDCKDVMALLPGSNAPSLASMSVPSMGNTNGGADQENTILTFDAGSDAVG